MLKFEKRLLWGGTVYLRGSRFNRDASDRAEARLKAHLYLMATVRRTA